MVTKLVNMATVKVVKTALSFSLEATLFASILSIFQIMYIGFRATLFYYKFKVALIALFKNMRN